MNTFERAVGRQMEDHPHMYDTQHKHYLNKQLRKAACETVANQLILERVVDNGNVFDINVSLKTHLRFFNTAVFN